MYTKRWRWGQDSAKWASRSVAPMMLWDSLWSGSTRLMDEAAWMMISVVVLRSVSEVGGRARFGSWMSPSR